VIEPTYIHALEPSYRRPGGPWDVPALDAALAPSTPPDLEDRIARIAGGLVAAGVGPHDAVCWQQPNTVESLVLLRACWRAGAVAVPIHHQAGAADVDAIVADVGARLVLDAATLAHGLPAGEPLPLTASRAHPHDAAVVLFTSGSSGRPKGVIHTHRALSYKARLMATVHGLDTRDAVLMPAPLAHISGLLNGVTLPGVAGMRSVLMAKWDPSEALRIIERERITFMIGPPTFFIGLMSAPDFTPAAVASLRLISCGGAGVTPAFVEEASATLGCTVKRTYGSTEAPTVTTTHAGDDPRRGVLTDGRPTGEVELSTDGTTGEVLVRGPELFCGYTDPRRNTEAFTADGWFRTGDTGVLDGDGWLTVTGRLKDIIIRGGENIAAAEVEATLEAHPDVRHAAAVGAPDARLGERVVAFVQLAPGAAFDVEACRAWFAQRGMARFKCPERVVVVDELPLLAAGKPDRAALRERAARLG